jgi:hypothetical protein
MRSKLTTVAVLYSLPGFHAPAPVSAALAFYAAVALRYADCDRPTITVCRAQNVPAVANARAGAACLIVQPRLCTKASMRAEAQLRGWAAPGCVDPPRILLVTAADDVVVMQPGEHGVPFAALLRAPAPEVAEITAALDETTEHDAEAATSDLPLAA